jgi:hypothetical protein
VSGALKSALEARADELMQLPVGWDSYQGLPTRRTDLDKAINIALALAPQFSSEPQLVPNSDGSVQIEWHVDGYDVEIWVSSARPAQRSGDRT